ncbi:cell cycle checkpoint protein RAD17 [Quillaja saponaria]|uniref:Cell cycle checkpoint protein RAD17 n=1 Tax=Quillaja saponaria TaxID=32244 RepID=A0AAD7L8G8_QUISA|nr:cell cycle checkpoint protein RAD17 [Quillaja saponaria]
MVMGKRNSIVVLSSDEEDKDYDPLLSSSYTKSKSRSSSPRTNSRGVKKARISGSRSRLCKESSKLNDVETALFSEDFNEVFTGCKGSAALGRRTEEQWVDKYKPHSLEELAVHKKKVEEVRMWFEERLRPSKDAFGNHVLVISGQAGVGKSTAINVIASHLGAKLYEWDTPTPEIWQEHLHNSRLGVQYTSKLDEFENFVERIRKYGLIQSSCAKESEAPIILLIDDLPVTNGKLAFGRLKKCLHLLVHSARVPTAILVTNYGNTDLADHSARCLEELQLSLESAGACKVAFNPVTTNSIKKVLVKISQLEQCVVTAELIDLIAKASGGDIRHAITSLQFFFLKPELMHSLSLSSPPSISEENELELDNLGDGFSLQFSRDETLSLYHALGKFLHNKRETEKAKENDQDAFITGERLARLPLKMDAPEKVLCQAHGQPRPIADFLHENVLDFLSEEAIDDAWTVASYLGDADLLLATFRGMVGRYNEAENVLQSAAASVAVRGVLFGNSHPLSSRWHAIRRPKLWQVEQTSLSNKNEMIRQRLGAHTELSSSDLSVVATEYAPVFKWLGHRASEHLDAPEASVSDIYMKDINIDNMSLDDQETEISDGDDDIEDW